MENNRLRWILSLISSAAIVVFIVYGVDSSSAYKIFMNGDLSFKHSQMKNNCQECHKPWNGVNNEACQKCHENKKHFLKEVNPKINHNPENTPCFNCHKEHRGKYYNIELVESYSCKLCHEGQGHPEMKNPQEKHPLNAIIAINHQLHFEAGAFAEEDCGMTCHVESSGSIFNLAKFDDACMMCHEVEVHSADAKDMTTCPTCHLKKTFKASQPVEQLLSGAKFTHKKHRKFQCSKCHGNIITTSDESSYMSLKDSSQCLDCHSDSMVSLDCITCHNFHLS